MTAKEYQEWVWRLSRYAPYSKEFDVEYSSMIRFDVPLGDRVSIAKVARARYKERRRITGQTITNVWVDEYALDRPHVTSDGVHPSAFGHDWATVDWETGYPGTFRNVGKAPELATGYTRGRWYGKSIVEQAMRDLAMSSNASIKFNTEGEKQMEKIDWHKPLRARHPETGRVQDQKVYTYKSGSQRVVWIEDRVYPVDDQGRTVAEVWYVGDRDTWPRVGALKGAKLVENVPEEKFFVGLYRYIGTSRYFLEDGGVMKTRDQVNLIKTDNQWIVDTRKSAEPPKAIAHNPEDYVTTYVRGHRVTTSELMTKAKAEAYVSEPGEQVVRVRTTPAPVDTSRYIQLYRDSPAEPWQINAHGPALGGGQEFTWAETKNRGASPTRTAIKVRD